MITIPTALTPQQAARMTELLLEARRQLRDAAGSKIYQANYAPTSGRIADLLRELGVDPN